MISIRRISLGGGYRYLMESVAVGDGAAGRSNDLSRYYASSGTPPGMFLGAGLADLVGGRGVEGGSEVTEKHLEAMLAGCADPISGKAVGGKPKAPRGGLPVAGFDLTFPVSFGHQRHRRGGHLWGGRRRVHSLDLQGGRPPIA